MTMSAQLMSAGANQQLISESLTEPEVEPEEPKPDYEEESGPSLADIQEEQPPQEDEEAGVLNLHHGQDDQETEPEPEPEPVEDHHIGIDEQTGNFANADQLREAVEEVQSKGSFKGKTILPPAGDYVPGGTLPDLDGVPSYTPGVVTNAPISATDEVNNQTNYNQTNNWQPPQNEDWQQPQNQEGYQPTAQEPLEQIPSNEPPVIPMSQGEPYIKPDELPKEHNEDQLSDEQAQSVLEQNNQEHTEIPEIKPEHSKREFLDHPPSTDTGDEEFSEEDEKPSIEYGPDKYSHYMTEPPKEESKLNSLDGAKKEETIDPLANIPSSGPMGSPGGQKPKEDPWLSTQHDAESPRANEVPETRNPRLYDDGVERYNKPLGPQVDDDDTLDQIEHSVEETTGSVHGKKEQQAREALQNVVENLPEQENPLQYLELDSDPAKADEQPGPNFDSDGGNPPPAPPPLMPPAF
jgi:hypothetical protein